MASECLVKTALSCHFLTDYLSRDVITDSLDRNPRISPFLQSLSRKATFHRMSAAEVMERIKQPAPAAQKVVYDFVQGVGFQRKFSAIDNLFRKLTR